MKGLTVALVLLAASASAATHTDSERVAKLGRAVGLFQPLVNLCGPALLREWHLTVVPRHLTFAVDDRGLGRAVAGTHKDGEQIILFPSFFEQSDEDNARYLVHEWLHTQGLGEKPVQADGPTTQEINRSVWAACSASLPEAKRTVKASR